MSQRLVFNISIFPQRNKHINPDLTIEAYDICSDIAKYEPNLTDTFDLSLCYTKTITNTCKPIFNLILQSFTLIFKFCYLGKQVKTTMLVAKTCVMYL